jgi:hypothetical protein
MTEDFLVELNRLNDRCWDSSIGKERCEPKNKENGERGEKDSRGGSQEDYVCKKFIVEEGIKVSTTVA